MSNEEKKKGAGIAANRLPAGQNLQKKVSKVIHAETITISSITNLE